MHHELLQSCLLGQGTFGIVVKALDLRCDSPQEVAIKLLPRGDVVSSRHWLAGWHSGEGEIGAALQTMT